MAFYDNWGKKISQTSQGAVQKAQNYAEAARLTGVVNDLWKQIDEIYRQIGEIYFTEHQRNPEEDPYRHYLFQILDLRAQADGLWKQVCDLKGIRPCPKCGFENRKDDDFCSRCGFMLSADPEAGAMGAGQQVCRNCGKILGPGQMFCTGCGQPAEASPDVPEEENEADNEQKAAPLICSNCGKTINAGMRFCIYCGEKLDMSAPDSGLTEENLPKEEPVDYSLDAFEPEEAPEELPVQEMVPGLEQEPEELPVQELVPGLEQESDEPLVQEMVPGLEELPEELSVQGSDEPLMQEMVPDLEDAPEELPVQEPDEPLMQEPMPGLEEIPEELPVQEQISEPASAYQEPFDDQLQQISESQIYPDQPQPAPVPQIYPDQPQPTPVPQMYPDQPQPAPEAQTEWQEPEPQPFSGFENENFGFPDMNPSTGAEQDNLPAAGAENTEQAYAGAEDAENTGQAYAGAEDPVPVIADPETVLAEISSESAPASEAPGAVICPSCGKRLEATDKFCMYCGQKLF